VTHVLVVVVVVVVVVGESFVDDSVRFCDICGFEIHKKGVRKDNSFCNVLDRVPFFLFVKKKKLNNLRHSTFEKT
jgi:hypothetical protein